MQKAVYILSFDRDFQGWGLSPTDRLFTYYRRALGSNPRGYKNQVWSCMSIILALSTLGPQEVEAEGPGFQGHPWLHSEVILGCTRSYFNNKKT